VKIKPEPLPARAKRPFEPRCCTSIFMTAGLTFYAVADTAWE